MHLSVLVGLGVSPRFRVGPLRVLVRYWTWMTTRRTTTRLEIVTNIYLRRGQGLRARAPPHGERAVTAPRPHQQASASIASSRLSSLLPGTSLAPGRGPRQRAWAAPCGDALRLSACTVGLRHGHTKKRYDLRLTSSASVRSRSPPFKQMSNCAKASSSVGLRWPALQRGLTGRWTTGLGSVDTSASV